MTFTVPYASAQTAGDLNVVIIGWFTVGAAITSVTDSSGNVYTAAVPAAQMEGNFGGADDDAGFRSRKITDQNNLAAALVVTAPGAYRATIALRSSATWVMQIAAFRACHWVWNRGRDGDHGPPGIRLLFPGPEQRARYERLGHHG